MLAANDCSEAFSLGTLVNRQASSISIGNYNRLMSEDICPKDSKQYLSNNIYFHAYPVNSFDFRNLQGDQLQLSQVTVDDEDEGEEEEEEGDEGDEDEGEEEESDGEGAGGGEEQNSRVREIEDISHMSEEY